MAPEQVEGQTWKVGPATDVYALGVILYELLTGRPPFLADTPFETLRQVVSAEPIPVSRLRTNLPRDLETICLKCLEKDPGERFASAEALAEDLRRFLAGEPIRARPPGWVEQLWRWSHRNRLVASLAALLVGSILTALALVTWQWQRAEANARAAQRNYEQSEENFAEAQKALHTFGLSFHEELRIRSGTLTSRQRLLEVGLRSHLRLLDQRGGRSRTPTSDGEGLPLPGHLLLGRRPTGRRPSSLSGGSSPVAKGARRTPPAGHVPRSSGLERPVSGYAATYHRGIP
jgi:serine/threonine protein kinase